MIAKIIPIKRLPLSLPWLDYQVPTRLKIKIKPGQLVKIPFRGQEFFGVVKELVWSNKLTINKEIKPVTEIVSAKPILSCGQLNFLQDMSEFYQVSFGWLLKINLLPLAKKKLADLNLKSRPKTTKQSKFSKPKLIIYQNDQAKLKYISENIASRGQNLILVPELTASQSWQFPDRLTKEITIITSELSQRELSDCWRQIWSGQKKIVIGTRRAIFSPWFNLKNIFLDDEANPNHKSWDMAPRFHTRDAALFLAKHHQAKLHLLTHTPSVETYYFAKHKVYQSDKELIAKINKRPTIVDMRNERKKKNYSFISDELVERIKKIQTGDIFFFLNRRGSANYVGCRDCGQVLRCTGCRNILTYHQDKNSLNCHYCQTIKSMINACSNCHGVNMAMYGVGTQLAESGIRKLFGDRNIKPIIRVDSDLKITHDLIKQMKSEQAKIIIGTQLVWPLINWRRISSMIFLDADTSLFVPEYKVSENLWYCLRHASYRLNAEAEFLLQTSHPTHPAFSCLSQPAKFYELELTERKLLGYPPYKFLLKLFYGHLNQTTAETLAAQVMTDLLGLTKTKPSVKLAGPIEAVPYFYKSKYWQVLLAKINYSSYKQDTKLLLTKLPSDWKVDPNPNNILFLN